MRKTAQGKVDEIKQGWGWTEDEDGNWGDVAGEDSGFSFSVIVDPDPDPVIAHALDIIRGEAPAEYEADREALHRALLDDDYGQFGSDFKLGRLDHELKPIAGRARGRGLEAVKDTFEMLKQCLESRTWADQSKDWSERAKQGNWTKAHRRKLPKMRAEARERLAAGGDPNQIHRVTDDLPLEDGWFVPGTVTDRWLAYGRPRHRQGPPTRYEEARQILFELTAGMLGLEISVASLAVQKLLLFYLGERVDHDALRWWWFTHRPPSST